MLTLTWVYGRDMTYKVLAQGIYRRGYKLLLYTDFSLSIRGISSCLVNVGRKTKKQDTEPVNPSKEAIQKISKRILNTQNKTSS